MYAVWYPKLTAFRAVTTFHICVLDVWYGSLACPGHLESRMHTRRADLLLAIYGRSGPRPELRAATVRAQDEFSETDFRRDSSGGRVAVSLTASVPASSAAGIDCAACRAR